MLKPKGIAESSFLLGYLPLEKVAEIKKLALEMKNQCGYDEPVGDSDARDRGLTQHRRRSLP